MTSVFRPRFAYPCCKLRCPTWKLERSNRRRLTFVHQIEFVPAEVVSCMVRAEGWSDWLFHLYLYRKYSIFHTFFRKKKKYKFTVFILCLRPGFVEGGTSSLVTSQIFLVILVSRCALSRCLSVRTLRIVTTAKLPQFCLKLLKSPTSWICFLEQFSIKCCYKLLMSLTVVKQRHCTETVPLFYCKIICGRLAARPEAEKHKTGWWGFTIWAWHDMAWGLLCLAYRGRY